MTYSRGRMLSALALLLCPMRPLAAQPPAALPSDPVRLQWLAGCWAQRAPGRLIEEQWMVPQGGVMIGMSRTVVRDTARSWEFLRIAKTGDRLAYIATPSGQAETTFPLVALSDTLVTFENPQHDFPQRISYRRIRSDSVVATISGTVNGRARASSFPMVRSRCVGA
ncbi:DUF6265 family protein [Gemmatimonas aurantiaca]|nr:DUF6265 family protein [Gemmatimonas aurantiaca]